MAEYKPLESQAIRDALLHKTIESVDVRWEEGDKYHAASSIEWIGLTFTDGSELEFSAHGMHTEGWVVVSKGRIYGTASNTERGQDDA